MEASVDAASAHPDGAAKHLGLQLGHQRRAEFLAGRLAPFGALTVEGPLDFEQGFDPADSLQCQRRDHRRLLALSLATVSTSPNPIVRVRSAQIQHGPLFFEVP
jgi:hypothetical protein